MHPQQQARPVVDLNKLDEVLDDDGLSMMIALRLRSPPCRPLWTCDPRAEICAHAMRMFLLYCWVDQALSCATEIVSVEGHVRQKPRRRRNIELLERSPPNPLIKLQPKERNFLLSTAAPARSEGTLHGATGARMPKSPANLPRSPVVLDRH